MRHHGSLFILIALTSGAAAAAYQGVLWVPDHQSMQFILGVVTVACAAAAGAFYVLRQLLRAAHTAFARRHELLDAATDLGAEVRLYAAAAWDAAPKGRPAPGTGGRGTRWTPAPWPTMRQRPPSGAPRTQEIPRVDADAPPPREASADNDDLLMLGWPQLTTAAPGGCLERIRWGL